jgi:hypothetical protein
MADETAGQYSDSGGKSKENRRAKEGTERPKAAGFAGEQLNRRAGEQEIQKPNDEIRMTNSYSMTKQK